MVASLSQEQIESQRFWNANPCGGSWASYNDFMDWIQRTEPYAFEIIKQHSWAGKKVLDAGCGQGTLLNYLPRLGATMFGLDISSESLHRAAAGAKELGYSGSVFLSLADAECLPFPDDCFDAVLSFGVLHHTPNILEGVRELWRVLGPGGLALVMLYRTGNPKWWMTRLVRGASHLADRLTGRSYTIADRLRSRHRGGDVRGTALLELFGCPILKAFSNKKTKELFGIFSHVVISNHQPGFQRMLDVFPILRPLESFLLMIDLKFTRVMGFYQVIEARK